PLVLHGGSGTHPDQLRRAIEIGITKVNVASEIGRAYLGAIRQAIDNSNGTVWYASALVEARKSVRNVVAAWMRQLGSVGKAP
ncbi:MAG: class II fructose-bisphosphate aldolase, partial [Armatimonadota bacterium]